MNGVTLILTMATSLIAVATWRKFHPPSLPAEFQLEAPETDDERLLRERIERKSGYAISQLHLEHGRWMAFTAYGWAPVESLLRRELGLESGANS